MKLRVLRQPALEVLGHAADLAHAGQEHENRAGLALERLAHDGGRVRFQTALPPRRVIADLDRKTAAFGDHNRAVVEQGREPFAVEGRRHHQQAQVFAQRLLRFARQRQAEVGLQGALVKFVEDHGGVVR